eukprot:scaffold276207_cov18-Prasinocladus_malaysianus.AAC.2
MSDDDDKWHFTITSVSRNRVHIGTSCMTLGAEVLSKSSDFSHEALFKRCQPWPCLDDQSVQMS